MLTPPYPLHPAPLQRSWLERHPRWKIPLGGLTLFFLMGIFAGTLITIITMSFHGSDVYKQALAKAADSPQVREQIGEPIKPAWLISGQLNSAGSSGSANLSIPISGPRGKGVIRAVAYKTGGVWRFKSLEVSVDGQSATIDLLSVVASSERDF